MCSLVTRNNWPRVMSNHRKLTCISCFVTLSLACVANAKGEGGRREKSTKEGKGKGATAIRAGVLVICPPFSQLLNPIMSRPFPSLPYPPPFSPFSLSPTPFDACYAGYSKSVMLTRLLLREHFQILGSYFLLRTNTVI